MRALPRRHWTPRYVRDRGRLAWRQRLHPDEPWLTHEAIRFLDAWVRPSDRCLEWGSGRSTMWLAARCASVVSVEHDPAWATRVTGQTEHLSHVRVHVARADDQDGYVNAAGTDLEADLALIDGIHRARCALTAVEYVVPGGVVVVDNVERYLPSSSHSPEAIGDRFESDEWCAFADATATWRRYWTTNGVTDTAFFFKPPI